MRRVRIAVVYVCISVVPCSGSSFIGFGEENEIASDRGCREPWWCVLHELFCKLRGELAARACVRVIA